MTRPVRLCAVAAAACALGLAACSSSDAPATGSATPSRSGTSAAFTADSRSSIPATSTSTASTTATSAPTPGATADAGAVAQRMVDAMAAAKSGKAQTTASVGGQAFTTERSFVYTSATQVDASGSTTIAGRSFEILSVGGTVYLKGFPTQFTGGKTWAKVDPNGTDTVSQQLRKASSDPNQIVDAVKTGQATVTAVGAGTTTYSITGVTYQDITNLTMEITVDGQGLPTTSKVSLPSSSSFGAVTVTYSDWGTPVTVSAPPADQVGALTLPAKS